MKFQLPRPRQGSQGGPEASTDSSLLRPLPGSNIYSCLTGGVASLNHRLHAVIPPGSKRTSSKVLDGEEETEVVPGLQKESGVAQWRCEKNTGPYCKRCYHKQARPTNRSPGKKAAQGPPDPDYDHCPECGVEADVCGGGACPKCRFEFSNALYWWFGR